MALELYYTKTTSATHSVGISRRQYSYGRRVVDRFLSFIRLIEPGLAEL